MLQAVRFAFAFLLLLPVALMQPHHASASASKAGKAAKTYEQLISKHARANDIPVNLARAVVKHESSFNPKATGRAGEIGLMQIKLSTARGMGYKGGASELYDPATNIRWGMKYLGQARKLAGGSECGTLSRYNGGHATTHMIKGYCSKVRLAMGG